MPRALAYAVLASLILATAAVADRVTVDPNTRMVKRTDAVAEVDRRLQQNVTIRARRQTVSEILEEMSRITGVTFRAGASVKDWQVRDRRMHVFCDKVPLSQLMDSIARTMKFKWETSDDTLPTYRLISDRKALLDAEAALKAAEERKKKWVEDTRKRSLDQLMRTEKMTDAELQKLRTSDPAMCFAVRSGVAKPLAGLLRTVPKLGEAAAKGEPLTLNVGELPQDARLLAQDLWEASRGVHDLFDGQATNTSSSETPDMSQCTISLRSCLDGTGSQDYGAAVLNCQMHSPQGAALAQIGDSENYVTKEYGKLALRALDSGLSDDELMEAITRIDGNAMAENATMFNFGEKQVDQPDDPALRAKIKLQIDMKKVRNADVTLPDILEELAKRSGFAVVSDCHDRGQGHNSETFARGEFEIRDLLGRIGKSHSCNWEKRASVIEFRDWQWFTKRQAQVPEATIEPWRKEAKRTQTLDLPTLAEMAKLTREQFNVVCQDEVLFDWRGLSGVDDDRALHLMYGALDASQREALFTTAGLDTSLLTPEQYEAVRKWVAHRTGDSEESKDARLMIYGTRKRWERQFEYRFRAILNPGAPPIRETSLTTPEYVGPAPDEKEQR